jgi:predicted NBD/HSP70 family sugar kinase
MLRTDRWNERDGRALGRAITEARVMDLLHGGPASRAAISRVTGLSKPTVSAVIRDLEEAGLVRLGGRASGPIGRSSSLYEVNPAAAFSLGVDIGGTSVRAVLTDVFGEVLAEAKEATDGQTAAGLVDQLDTVYRRLLQMSGVDRADVRAAGVSVPGVIHPDADRVTGAYNVPALAGMQPQRDIGVALGLPVVIANDVNLAAAGEQWRGSAADAADFVAISIGTGIGVGIVAGGSVYLGARGAAGEIGLLPLAPGPVDFGATVGGPLEDAASGAAALARLRAAVASGRPTSLAETDTLRGMFAAAADGDALATELVEEEARLLAFGIAAIVALIDPAVVVLGGGLGANPGLLEPVRRHVATMVQAPPEIVTSSLGGRASLMGAVAVALNAVRDQLLQDVRRMRTRRDVPGLSIGGFATFEGGAAGTGGRAHLTGSQVGRPDRHTIPVEEEATR